MNKDKIVDFFNGLAQKRLKWKKHNRLYHRSLEKYYKFIIPKQSIVLEVGCGTGELLNAVDPSYGFGIDFSEKMLDIAKNQFPHLNFMQQDAEELIIDKKFDYIIVSDLLGSLLDVQKFFNKLYSVCHPNTKIVISYHNYRWEPFLKIGEKLRLKIKHPHQNWLTRKDIENLLYLENFEGFKHYSKLLFPKYIPIFHFIFNKIFSNLPLFNYFNLINFIIARPMHIEQKQPSVSIVVPARNEKGNIENAIKRTPDFGSYQEFVFIEGNSSDGTWEEIERVKEKYKDSHKILTMKQSGKGKGNAVKEAFEAATGDVLMILDADLTTPPEDMKKFYDAIAQNKGEFINGCRLVYPMEKQAMRFLNYLGNRFFSAFFTYLLNQRLKDTLCGTKVLYKTDYEKIKANRSYFGDFDPFGDFDLIFGAAKLNLRMVEVIVRYRDREYGSTQISRFKHGWLLIKMSAFAAKKIKFI